MSHGMIAGFDSALRLAWYSDSKYPLSDALNASARLKPKLNARIHTENGMMVRRVLLSLQSKLI